LYEKQYKTLHLCAPFTCLLGLTYFFLKATHLVQEIRIDFCNLYSNSGYIRYMMIKTYWFANFKILYEKQYKAPHLFVLCVPFICLSRLTYFFLQANHLVQIIRVDFYKLWSNSGYIRSTSHMLIKKRLICKF